MIVSIDQGTSSTRVIVYDFVSSNFNEPNRTFKVLGQHQLEHTQIYPSPGYVEHCPLEIVEKTLKCLAFAITKAKANVEDSKFTVRSIGITNQRETTVVWNRKTGIPYHNAIVWNDTRTSSICEKLCKRPVDSRNPILAKGIKRYRAITGLPIVDYFSATKLLFLLDNVPGLREDAERGDAIFGTIDTWLLYRMTAGREHATDVSNASRTNLMNLTSLQWDDVVLADLNIPAGMLPSIKPSAGLFGHFVRSHFLPVEDPSVPWAALDSLEGVPITGILGDQQAALFGQTCFNKGETKITYGTGAFLLMNTGTEIVPSNEGLLTTVGYQLAGQECVYVLEGSIAYCGSVLQWVRDGLGMIRTASDSEAMASSVADNGGVFFVPAFSGLYAPHWRSDARGIIVGLTAFNTKAHIIRAALEASAFQTFDVVQAMHRDICTPLASSQSPFPEWNDNIYSSDIPEAFSDDVLPLPFSELRVDGGMSNNSLFLQFQSDLLNVPLLLPCDTETTALGAAFAAGLGCGLFASVNELRALVKIRQVWKPNMDVATRRALLTNWRRALRRSVGWHTTTTDEFTDSGKLKSPQSDTDELNKTISLSSAGEGKGDDSDGSKETTLQAAETSQAATDRSPVVGSESLKRPDRGMWLLVAAAFVAGAATARFLKN